MVARLSLLGRRLVVLEAALLARPDGGSIALMMLLSSRRLRGEPAPDGSIVARRRGLICPSCSP